GFILYDTSRIVHGGETNYIIATTALYLNIYNLFVSLLHILGALNGDD
ncbi:MAG: Bax inhibitor-1 family protein, partial [Marinobacter sp.]|nr:Bax inhibitor-1 family protein [Marinobacter sp.]